MIRKWDWKTECCTYVFLVCVSSNLFAGSFSETFKNFILDKGEPDRTSIDNPAARLPDLSHSIRCMECHDGSQARGVALKHADTTIKFSGRGSVNHPVGMNYRYYANKDPAVFVPAEQLDSRIILENGEVTCISCHALKNTSPQVHGNLLRASVITTDDEESTNCTASKNLTTGSTITKLCLSCHAM